MFNFDNNIKDLIYVKSSHYNSNPTFGSQILQGIAEICGVKLENNLKYYFGSHSNVTIFTYHGCSISVIKGSSTTCIETSNETSVVSVS